MASNNTARAAAEYARPPFRLVKAAISTMRAADLEREAISSLRAVLLRQLVDDLAALNCLDAIAVRLAQR